MLRNIRDPGTTAAGERGQRLRTRTQMTQSPWPKSPRMVANMLISIRGVGAVAIIITTPAGRDRSLQQSAPRADRAPPGIEKLGLRRRPAPVFVPGQGARDPRSPTPTAAVHVSLAGHRTHMTP